MRNLSRVCLSLIAGFVFVSTTFAETIPSGDIIITSDTGWPEGDYQLASLTIVNGATLTLGGGSTVNVSGTLTVTGNSTLLTQSKNNSIQVNGQWQGQGVTISTADVQVDAGSKISADGQGYAGTNCSGAGNGPGGGPLNCNNNGNGGSHGGKGGGPNSASMTTYGSQFAPLDLGSGGSGGCGWYGGAYGGSGGGAIRLLVSGTLANNGMISANGADGGPGGGSCGWSGSGAGGAIHATVGTLTGSGVFTANGGAGEVGGGGGRVAVYYANDGGFGGFTASTATGASGGGDGSVVFIDNSRSDHRLYVAKRFVLNQDTVATYDSITVDNGGVLEIGGGSHVTVLNGISVIGNSSIIARAKDNTGPFHTQWQGRGVTISAAAVRIDAGSKISADGQGYAGTNCSGAGNGPGGGQLNCNNNGNGGSHGGKGGGPNSASMTTYGSQFAPLDLGSGGSGGCGWYGGAYGGSGGGAVRLLVSGTLANNGMISANGSDGGPGGGSCGWSGSGSGGSIYATAGTLAGSGVFTANGGAGEVGGGGRVAVYYANDGDFGGLAGSTSNSGSSSSPGQPGTVLFSSSAPPFSWLTPSGDLLHDTVRLSGGALALDSSTTTVDIIATGADQAYAVGTHLKILFGIDWNTRSVPDGRYELRLIFRDADNQTIREVTRVVAVNNSVLWHSGVIANSETWAADKIHVIEGTLVIPSGVHVTIQPGTIVKVTEDSRIIIEDGGILDSLGTDQARIVFTSVYDGSVGGDTTFSTGLAKPLPGSWLGISAQGSGQANLNNYTDLRYARTDRSGTIAASETWLGTYVYHVTGDIYVPSGVTLTIQPGAVVKFDPATGIIVQPGGRLIANGSTALPIYFTSIRDDSVGGDTNGDGPATSPAAGNWRWFYIDGAQASFDHVAILYGGGTSDGVWNQTGVIRLNGSSTVTLSNSMVKDAFFDGVLAWGGIVTITSSTFTGIDRAVSAHPGGDVTVTNCTFDNNRIGLLVHGGTLNVANTIVTNSSESGIQYDFGILGTVRYSDIWAQPSLTGSVNYRNTSGLTGINGNISADPLYKNRQQGDFRLDIHSPGIDAADGSVAPISDFMGAPRYDDPRTVNSGIPTVDGKYADMGAYEFVETASSAIDLAVAEVSGPQAAIAGVTAAIEWDIVNIGSAAAVGPWHDRISVVNDLTGQVIQAAEFLTGAGVAVGPGQTYHAQASVKVPGALPGSYHWRIDTNSRYDVFEGQNMDNNFMISPSPVTLDLVQLDTSHATPQSFLVTGANQEFRYKFSPSACQNLQLQLGSSNGSDTADIYVGKGYMPTAQAFDIKSRAGQNGFTALVPCTSTETYYLLIVSTRVDSGSSTFTLTANPLVFGFDSITPARVGSGASATIAFAGKLLGPEMTYEITGNGLSRGASSVVMDSSGTAYATFSTAAVPPGKYSVKVTRTDGVSAALNDVLTLETATDPTYNVSVSAPSLMRNSTTAKILVTYENTGNRDVALPFITLSASGGSFSYFKDGVTAANKTQLLAKPVVPGLALLPPGKSGSVTLYYSSPQVSGSAKQRIEIYANTVDDPVFAGNTLDWAAISASMKPAGVDEAAWAAFVAAERQKYGDTYGSFFASLGAQIKGGGNNGTFVDGRWLFDFKFRDDLPPVPRSDPEPPDENSGSDTIVAAKAVVAKVVAAAVAQGYSNVTVIIIGASDYKGNNSDLPGVQNDVTNLQNYFGQTLGIPAQNIHTVENPQTFNDVNTAYVNNTQNVGQNDLVIVWNSSHGSAHRTYDANGNRTGTDYTIDYPGGSATPGQFNQMFSQTPGRVLFVTDSCHSGGFVNGITAQNVTSVASAQANQTASDKYSGDTGTGNLQKGGLFTTAMLIELQKEGDFQDAYTGASASVVATRGGTKTHRQQLPSMNDHVGTNIYFNISDSRRQISTSIQQTQTSSTQNQTTRGHTDITVASSNDPNEKTGPAGYGGSSFILPNKLAPYSIFFENKSNAALPAQTVEVTDVLPDTLDLDSLQLTEYSFGKYTIEIPAGFDSYATTLDMTADGVNLFVNIGCGLDAVSRVLTCTFTSIDPLTGAVPEDPLSGFLPPNDATHRGEGHISFTIRAKDGLATGDTLRNSASIVFDKNPPLSTNETLNTIDADPPASGVSSLPSSSPTDSFTVSWSGSDAAGSGIASYTVHVALDGGAFTPWIINTTDTSSVFNGTAGHTYRFYSIGTDNAGNRQAAPATTQATTTAPDCDINSDGTVTIVDALLALRIAVKLDPGSQSALVHGDIYKDGDINIADALFILRKVVGLYTY